MLCANANGYCKPSDCSTCHWAGPFNEATSAKFKAGVKLLKENPSITYEQYMATLNSLSNPVA